MLHILQQFLQRVITAVSPANTGGPDIVIIGNPDMGRGITLQRAEQSEIFINNRGEGFRLAVLAYDAESMPAEIFVHQKRLTDPDTGLDADEFQFVCSPLDLSVYPANEPDATQYPQFFRKASFDIVVASNDMASEAWIAIQAEVSSLVAALNKMDTLAIVEEVRIGDAITESISVSL